MKCFCLGDFRRLRFEWNQYLNYDQIYREHQQNFRFSKNLGPQFWCQCFVSMSNAFVLISLIDYILNETGSPITTRDAENAQIWDFPQTFWTPILMLNSFSWCHFFCLGEFRRLRFEWNQYLNDDQRYRKCQNFGFSQN